MSQRRQFSSCDPCRRSKRRCYFVSAGKGETCTNCRRLGHSCTFDFAKSRKAKPRQDPTPYPQPMNRNKSPVILANGLSNTFPGHFQADSMTVGDVLPPLSNFDEASNADENPADGNYDFTLGLGLTDLVALDAEPLAPVPIETQLSFCGSPLERTQSAMPFITGSSLSSPMRLLNSKLDATILDERLITIHNTIVTGCASRFADYDCNLYATTSRYRLESGARWLSQEYTLDLLGQELTKNDMSYTLTAIGTVRFLDHFSDLYGNRLSPGARKLSDAALKAVLRAFSLQWLTPERSSATDSIIDNSHTTCDISRNAFFDSWFTAREVLRNAQSIQSFRTVYAILLFDGIAVPAKASAESAHEFLDIGLQNLCSLDALVRQYCTNLAAYSTYSGALEASLNVMRWGGYIRDIGASLTTDRRCRLPAITGCGKMSFSKEYSFDNVNDPDFFLNLDGRIPNICQNAVAEAFYVWRQIIDAKQSMYSDLSSACIEAFTSAVAAVSKFNRLFRPFFNHCLANLEDLSIHSKTTSISLVLFWDLGVLTLAQSLESYTKKGHLIHDSTVRSMRVYQEEAVLSVTRTVECVILLPTEDIFNLENGLGAEVPLISYHITPRLTAMVFEKAIETLIYLHDSRVYPANSLQIDPTDSNIWQRRIDILLKGISSLNVIVGGSEAATSAFQSLMPRHGDILSECWTSDFST
ncbi:unnamed protein product [Penicillium pancosmium]